jgi:hypothetical protein
MAGWSFPNNISLELVNNCGPFLESASHFPYVFGWIDENSYLDDITYQAKGSVMLQGILCLNMIGISI